MASAIFVVPFQIGLGPVIPLDLGLVDGYGFSVVGHVPAASTCLTRAWSDEATLDALAALPDVLFVEDIADAKAN